MLGVRHVVEGLRDTIEFSLVILTASCFLEGGWKIPPLAFCLLQLTMIFVCEILSDEYEIILLAVALVLNVNIIKGNHDQLIKNWHAYLSGVRRLVH